VGKGRGGTEKQERNGQGEGEEGGGDKGGVGVSSESLVRGRK